MVKVSAALVKMQLRNSLRFAALGGIGEIFIVIG